MAVPHACADEELLGDSNSISKHVREVLVEMALRDLQGHKFAYRVGVFAPQAPLSHIPTEPDDVMGDIISRMLQPSIPGVMQIKVVQAAAASGASRFKLDKSGRGSVRSSISGKQPGEESIAPFFRSASIAVADSSGIKLEVTLYKSELLTGVLHLDSQGTIIDQPGRLQLYPPGLLLGVDLSALAGHHVSKVVPQMKGRPLNDIFLLNSGGIEQKKGGLKGFRGTMAEKSATTIITTSHLFDEEGLQLELQPIRAANPKNGVYVVMHLFKPNCGPDRLNEWLQVSFESGDLCACEWQATLNPTTHPCSADSRCRPTQRLASSHPQTQVLSRYRTPAIAASRQTTWSSPVTGAWAPGRSPLVVVKIL